MKKLVSPRALAVVVVALVASLLAAPAQAAVPTLVSANVNIMSAAASALSQSASAALQVASDESVLTVTATDGTKVQLADKLVRLDQEQFDKLKAGEEFVFTVDGRTIPASPGRGRTYANVKGHKGDVYARYWIVGGKAMLCIDYILHNPNGSSSTVKVVKGDKAKGVTLIANDVKLSDNNFVAEGHAWAAWLRQGGKPINTSWNYLRKSGRLTKGMVPYVNNLLARSRLHGPYKVTVASYDKPAYGKYGKALITVKASNGKPAKNKRFTSVALSDNVRVTSAPKRLNSKGQALVRYRVNKLVDERVRIRSCVREASSYKALFTNPSNGRQRLEGGGFEEHKCATFGWGFDVKGSFEQFCPDNCLGIGRVINDICAPAGKPLRLRNVGSNGVTRRLDVKGGTCVKQRWSYPDKTRVVADACELNKMGGTCVSAWFQLGALWVKCITWPTVGVCTEQGCESSKFTKLYGGLTVDSPRFFEAWWILPDGKKVTESLPQDKTMVQRMIDVNAEPGAEVRRGFTVYNDAEHTKRVDTIELDPVVIGD